MLIACWGERPQERETKSTGMAENIRAMIEEPVIARAWLDLARLVRQAEAMNEGIQDSKNSSRELEQERSVAVE
jgi:hypothetical protein